MDAEERPGGWRAVYAHPAAQIFVAALQTYVALGLFGVVPGWAPTGHLFSKVLGVALLLSAVAHVVSVVRRRATS